MARRKTSTKPKPDPNAVESVKVQLPEEPHHSKWYAGIGGETVKALRLTVNTGAPKPQVVLVYDGDGEGTEKFIKHGGDTVYGHREVVGAVV